MLEMGMSWILFLQARVFRNWLYPEVSLFGRREVKSIACFRSSIRHTVCVIISVNYFTEICWLATFGTLPGTVPQCFMPHAATSSFRVILETEESCWHEFSRPRRVELWTCNINSCCIIIPFIVQRIACRMMENLGTWFSNLQEAYSHLKI